MARKGVEHNQFLLAFNMFRGGISPLQAWVKAGNKIKRSKAAIAAASRKKSEATIWGV